MLAALDQLGVPHRALRAGLLAAHEGETPAVDRMRAHELPCGMPIVLHVNAPLLPAALLRLPRRLLRGRRVIGYWAWELPVTPPGWRAGLPFVHEIWVPSRFTATALAPLLPGRIRVVPHAVAASPPRPAALDRQAFGLPAGAVVTLVSFSLASSFARKNPLGAIAAHQAAFGRRQDRILVLKLANTAHYADDLARLRAAIGDAPNIRLDTRTMPIAELHALTLCSDIVLSLHRSEGFGLGPAEAMLLGRPVVATGWSGNLDYMDPASAALIGFRLVPARDPRGVFQAPGAMWAEPDIAEAAAALAFLADNPADRAALGQAGRQAAAERLSAAPLAAALRAMDL